MVEEVEENEDGSAKVSFELDKKEAQLLQELGVKLVLYCVAAEKSTDEVFEWLSKEMFTSEYEFDEQVRSDD